MKRGTHCTATKRGDAWQRLDGKPGLGSRWPSSRRGARGRGRASSPPARRSSRARPSPGIPPSWRCSRSRGTGGSLHRHADHPPLAHRRRPLHHRDARYERQIFPVNNDRNGAAPGMLAIKAVITNPAYGLRDRATTSASSCSRRRWPSGPCASTALRWPAPRARRSATSATALPWSATSAAGESSGRTRPRWRR